MSVSILPGTTLSQEERQPHHTYRESGVEWLSEIPTHWDVKRVKHGYSVQLGKMLQNEPVSTLDTLMPYLRSANVTWQGVDLSDIKDMWFSPYDKSLYKLEPGDLVVCEGGDVGRSALWNGELPECYIQNAVHRVQSKYNCSTKFLYYWLLFVKSAGYIDLICNKATIAHLTVEKLREIPMFVPALSEQRAIVVFLDRETAKIDALVAKKERLIELLQEKRTAVISQVVTRGLDPSVSMKDSGVRWLGKIPAHWQKKRIKHVLLQIMDTEHKTAPFYLDGEYLVVRTSNVRQGKLILDDAKYTNYEGYLEWTRRGRPMPGDILFTREAPAGEACLVLSDTSLCIGQRMVLFRVSPRLLDGNYGVWSLYGGLAAEFIHSLSQGSTVNHFNMQDIGNIPLLIPPLAEQRAIVDYLSSETAKIDMLITKVHDHIDKLREYRTALISAAVTGKIDVRGEAS